MSTIEVRDIGYLTAREVAQGSGESLLDNFGTPSTLRRDKTGAVDNVKAIVTEDGSALMQGKRPFVGDALVVGEAEWVIEEVGGWGEQVELWRLTIGVTQPADSLLPAPTITLRRQGSLLRIDFTDGESEDETRAVTFDETGTQVGQEWRQTLSAVDKQLVVRGVSDGWSVSVWYVRGSSKESARTTQVVPAL